MKQSVEKVHNRSVTHSTLDDAQLEAVASLFGVLAESSRLRLLQVLQTGDASVGELVKKSGLKQANVSRQLGLLYAASLIDRRPSGNRVIYGIRLPLVFELCRLVCDGVSRLAGERAAALGAAPYSTGSRRGGLGRPSRPSSRRH